MNEWELLKRICVRHPERESDAGSLRAAMAEISWGELIEQAIRHKVMPLLARELLQAAPESIPPQIRLQLRSVLAANTYRTRVLQQAVDEVQRAFDTHDLRACPVKGAVFAQTIYAGTGTRFMNDIDFMVQPADLAKAGTVLERCGFIVGEFEPDSVSLRLYSRREMVFYQLNPDHLPIMTRLTGDLIVPAVRVDIACNLTWDAAPWQLPAELSLAKLDSVAVAGNGRIRCMSPGYQFAHTALHLFREAWLERWLETGQDVNLAKFTDLYRLWYRYRGQLRTDLAEMLGSSNIGEPLAWVATHADRAFSSNLLQELELAGYLDEDFLRTVCGTDGRHRSWDGDMDRRLQAKDRHYVFERR